MFTDEELMARVDLFLPLIGSAPWQHELALTVLREVQQEGARRPMPPDQGPRADYQRALRIAEWAD